MPKQNTELCTKMSLRVTVKEKEALEKISEKYGNIGISAVVRMAIREFLEKNNG